MVCEIFCWKMMKFVLIRTHPNLSAAHRERAHESSSSVSWTTHRQGCSTRLVPFLPFQKMHLTTMWKSQKAILAWPSLVEQQLWGPSSSQASYGEQLANKFNCMIAFWPCTFTCHSSWLRLHAHHNCRELLYPTWTVLKWLYIMHATWLDPRWLIALFLLQYYY